MGLMKKVVNGLNPVKRVFIANGRQEEAEELMKELGISKVEKVDLMKYKLGFNGGSYCVGSRYTLMADPITYSVFKSKFQIRNEGKPLEIL